MYGIESWGGALKTTITKLQNIQDKMTKLTLGNRGQNMSSKQRQRFLGWLPIHLEIQSAAHRMTFKVINSQIPEEIASLMPMNNKALRIANKRTLDTKPAWLSKSKAAKSSYRGHAYLYNTLPDDITTELKFKKFKNKIRQYFLEKY